ncbi:DUF2336 domain-containing protein [Dongia sedimenti]|uniref:DUF2336 domain-containing protein n=1 Tax=Dongia sedimenti TaxID=3064282 RepID=A0ABU0YVK5_9PROT|nr:DUF2336 domain-containing protein [Rhodospirillaceae bacterium R-7]
MIDYKKAKALAADPDPETRRRLAERGDVQPEILYFLAEDAEPEIRAAIAGNSATPRQADLVLAKDTDVGVRERLAHKIGRLAPNLSGEERAHIRELTLEVIGILAADRTARVRQVIAESLRHSHDAPLEVIRQLARDAEIKVAGPILESSPLLTDDELISIIRSKPIQGALEAIARRRRLGTPLADALVTAALSVPDGVLAVTELLKNHNAEIDAATMDRIFDVAPTYSAWHAPLVGRPTLGAGAMRRLAQFVSQALLGALKKRKDADPETVAAIAATEEDRLVAESSEPEDAEPAEAAENDEAVADAPVGEDAILAAIQAGQLGAVRAAIARDSGLPVLIVRKILGSASGKAITSLAWKAQYSVALAVALQIGPGAIPADQALQPRDGEYPLSDADMEWQLELSLTPTEAVTPPAARRASA